MTYIYAVLATLVLGLIARWIWIQGVQAGWDDAAHVARIMGAISSRSSWIACGRELRNIGPTRLGISERCITETSRMVMTTAAIMTAAADAQRSSG